MLCGNKPGWLTVEIDSLGPLDAGLVVPHIAGVEAQGAGNLMGSEFRQRSGNVLVDANLQGSAFPIAQSCEGQREPLPQGEQSVDGLLAPLPAFGAGRGLFVCVGLARRSATLASVILDRSGLAFRHRGSEARAFLVEHLGGAGQ